MQYQALFALLAVLGSSSAHPIRRTHSLSSFKREVPQEHSHERIITKTREMLNLDNVEQIGDPIFGLLGNAAAAAGAGSVTNLDCLQQATADRAFTNAKAANDVDGQVAALTFRALERNTGAVGQASVICTDAAVNPEIAALSQHQDPASDGAAATNKEITLTLAVQIALVGGDPQLALDSGTFAPGQIGDPTGAGNTCDDTDDPEGCIFTKNLLVPDATPEKIDAAVAAGGAGAGADAGAEGGNLSIQTIANPTATQAGNAAAGGAGEATATGCPVVEGGAGGGAGAGAGAGAANGGAAVPVNNAAAAGIDVGPCTDFSMTFTAGLQGRKADEFSFEPTDLTNFNHGTALNPAIISEFMCDTFVNACARSAATRDTCKTVKADIDAQLASGALARDQTYADAWLSGLETAFGITSAGAGTGTGGGAVDAGAGEGGDAAGDDAAGDAGAGANAGVDTGAGADEGAGDAGAGDAAGGATGGDAGGSAGAGNGAAAAGIDIGQCTDFSMTFAAGQDGRNANEFSFLPTDRANFAQGSALNPAIISNAMCDTFVNACARSAATRDACKVVKADIDAQLAAGTLARDQTYADAWLSGLEEAFGVQSTGVGSGGAGGGAAVDTGAGAGAGADDAAVDAAADTGADAGAADEADAETGNEAGGETGADTGADAGAGAAGNNIQTFAGALNGVSATPVLEDQTAARPFSVRGDTFLNKGAALQRSCAQQHNGCADAANSGGAASVGECDAQEAQCNAAAAA